MGYGVGAACNYKNLISRKVYVHGHVQNDATVTEHVYT